jgi:hypothetical protein
MVKPLKGRWGYGEASLAKEASGESWRGANPRTTVIAKLVGVTGRPARREAK